MDNPIESIESLFEKIEMYSKTSYDLFKLRVLETVTVVATSLLSRLVVIAIFFVFVFFLNIGIALMVGDLLGKLYYGFLLVAIFYLVIGIIFHFFFHKWTKKVLVDLIVTQALQ